MPRSTWKNALNAFQNIEDKVEVAEKLQILIGKLNAYKNKNTREKHFQKMIKGGS